MLLERTSLGSKLLVCAGLVVYLVLSSKIMSEKAQVEFFVYRTGSQLAQNQFPPYFPAIVQARVADQFPPENDDDFANHCAYTLPPQGIIVFLPFAKMDWWQAQGLWFFFLTGMGLLSGLLAYSFGRSREHRGRGWAIVACVVLLNPITLPATVAGQTPLLFIGCWAMGQFAFENDCPRLGTFLWSVPFIKPLIALPFLLLAWVLGGWRRMVGIVLCVAIWNLLGGLIVTGNLEGSYGLFRIYLEMIGHAHELAGFDHVADHYEMLSWNRMIAASGGTAIDLTVWTTLAGFGAWGLVVFVRMRSCGASTRLDQAYLLAVTATGTLVFTQLLAHELLLLAFLTPLVLQDFDAGRKRDAFTLFVFLLVLMIPMNLMNEIADSCGFAEESRQRTLMCSHKCFGLAALALYLLIRGPSANEALPPGTVPNRAQGLPEPLE